MGIFVLASSAWARVEAPALTGPVIDTSQLLSTADKKILVEELRSYLPWVQVQIWIFPTLDGEDIEGVSIRAVEKWKLGTEKQDNGVLITVATEDRRMRIEVGQGLEGQIPDVLAGRIVDQVMRPAFKTGDFVGGLVSASRQIYSLAGGDISSLKPVQNVGPKKVFRRGGLSDLIFLGAFILISILLSCLNSGRRRSFWGSSGWGGGGGGFGGFGGGGGGGWSGGGWSGGGGGFSGGGSSGSW